MFETGVAGKFFYLGDDSDNGHLYGLVNIAAFLGQSMKETIQYDGTFFLSLVGNFCVLFCSAHYDYLFSSTNNDEPSSVSV